MDIDAKFLTEVLAKEAQQWCMGRIIHPNQVIIVNRFSARMLMAFKRKGASHGQ